MQKFLEKYLLPIAMVLGITFYKQILFLAPFVPIFLFAMLFVTYSRVQWRNIKLTKFHYILLSIQYIGSGIIYLVIRQFSEVVAQAAMICILAPTATSAPVVAGLLGGNISTVAAYSIISNLSVALIAPIFLSLVGHTGENIQFATSFWYILKKVVPLLLFPFVFAFTLQKISPKIHKKVQSAQILSFYIWAIALTVVLAQVTSFVVSQPQKTYFLEIIIVLSILVICLLQFYFGRRIGAKFGNTVAGGQGLGQKNTILAIWLTHTYLNPIATLGPGSYVLWQNLVNSYQIWQENNRKTRFQKDKEI